MKKSFVLGLFFGLPLLLGGCAGDQMQNHTEAQEEVGALPPYGFEAHHMSLEQVGQMLERIGREIQENGTITLGGQAYPFSGSGGIELSLNRRSREGEAAQSMFYVDFSSDGRSGPPTEGQAYSLYEGSIAGTPAEIADALESMAGTLSANGAFEFDFHRADFMGSALIDHRLGQSTGNPRQPFQLMLDITYGEGEFQRHNDREDIQEFVEMGKGVWLGDTSVEGVDQAGLVEVLQELAAAVRSGQVAVGEGEAELGEEARLSFGHVAAVDGSSDKIEMNLRWSTLPPPEQQAQEDAPRYYDEPWNMPVTEFAQMLQRIATEILADGMFMLDGREYSVGETLRGEIGFNPRGMVIEVAYNR